MGYYLDDTLTGERVPAVISRLSRKEVMLVSKKQFHFDWSKETPYEVYALRLARSTTILGLVSIDHQPQNRAIEIRLIANAKEHTGVGKRLDRIAGSLLAFVCMNSFDAGFDGFVYLIPKTHLIKVYREKYGFRNTGTSMFLNSDDSKILIQKYHESSDQEGIEGY